MADDIITITATVNDIAGRLARGEPVTKNLIDSLPADTRVFIDATVTTADGSSIACVIEIHDGEVTLHRAGDPGVPPSLPVQ
jgi:hypothetical protein